MKYSYITEHPNFKFIIKNKKLVNKLPFYILSDVYDKHIGYSGKYAAFYLNYKVFVQTVAGDIELFEKDFLQ